ncbi:hypothetical protein B296_00016441 [Ensete ventricosum]|uniref:ABC transmembrane type-1 domain-containing protein n=1 Tax=Ensete ventricosum TaxID=4639 RepID=A0A427A3W4_ENSVE|nr:hypothetical protein B296_00016441 [Ensete ventricosum]
MWTGERQSTKMRIKYLEAALNQDVRYFDTEVRTSDVVFAINADAVTVQDAISEKVRLSLRGLQSIEMLICAVVVFLQLGNFIHYIATFVSGFVVGFTAVWQLALVTLAVVPLIAIIGGIHTFTLTKLSSKSQDALAYSSALRAAQKIGYRSGFAKGLGLGATYFTVFCCYALLLWYGGHLVRHHHTNGGLAISTMFAVMIGGLALGQSAPSMAAFAKARVAAAKIYQTIEHEPSIDRENDTGIELGAITGLVELNNVDFAYPSRPDVPVLCNFSLTVAAGKTLALVGSSGSGKSTVVSLLERFYDPTSATHNSHLLGQILLDGHDIKTLKLRWLRQQIGLVSQEPALFATTIKENLLLGREDATQAEIEEAARVANAHSFIVKLRDGYDSQVCFPSTGKQRCPFVLALLSSFAVPDLLCL